MNRRYRKTIIAGNWKMNKTSSEAKEMIEKLKPRVGKAKWCDVVLCVSPVKLVPVTRYLRDSRISVGAQNMHEEEFGAYTGEVSGAMLKDTGCKYVIIGHSERRRYFNETDFSVNRKIKLALELGLRPIVCVGESLEEREMDLTLDVITLQIRAALAGIPADKMRRIAVAYEPIWAIGTGKTATAEQAGEVNTHIRAVIRKQYGARVSRSVSILYGGSMSAKNAYELLAQPDIDGGLIGGASLCAEEFSAIVHAANQPH